MLIDRAEVDFKAGNGGHGRSSFRRGKKGPDGGNGGRGGDLYVVAESDLTLMNQFSRETEFSAGDGEPGGKNQMSGKSGFDLEIKLPVGTGIFERQSNRLILELNKVGDRYLLCRGGKGGFGNWEFRGPENTTPRFAEPGGKGETRKLFLSLRLIADYGLVGLPNAGKSSLLNELTNAKAKIANYPFTTLSPNLGVMDDKYLADIPGLIEGASAGKGLGIGFLKHIEKVSKIIHCISSESSDIEKDYEVVRNELKQFNPTLLEKEEIILLTKSDLQKTKNVFKSKQVLNVSIYDPKSIEKLKKLLI